MPNLIQFQAQFDAAKAALVDILSAMYKASSYKFLGQDYTPAELIANTVSDENLNKVLDKLINGDLLDGSVFFYNDADGADKDYKGSEYDPQLTERFFVLYYALLQAREQNPDAAELVGITDKLHEILLELPNKKSFGVLATAISVGRYVQGSVDDIMLGVGELSDSELPGVDLPLRALLELDTGVAIFRKQKPSYAPPVTSEQKQIMRSIKKKFGAEDVTPLTEEQVATALRLHAMMQKAISASALNEVFSRIDLKSVESVEQFLEGTERLDIFDEMSGRVYSVVSYLPYVNQWLPDNGNQGEAVKLYRALDISIQQQQLAVLAPTLEVANMSGQIDEVGKLTDSVSAYNTIVADYKDDDTDPLLKLEELAKKSEITISDRISACLAIQEKLTQIRDTATVGTGRFDLLSKWHDKVNTTIGQYQWISQLPQDQQGQKLQDLDQLVLRQASEAVSGVKADTYQLSDIFSAIFNFIKSIFGQSSVSKSSKLSERMHTLFDCRQEAKEESAAVELSSEPAVPGVG